MKYYPLRKIRTTQGFGVNPATYKQFGMNGHNGRDLRTRFVEGDGSGETYKNQSATINGTKYTEDTKNGNIFAYANEDGVVTASAFESGGYGNYIKLSYGKFEATYGHLKISFVKTGDKVKAGQIIGITNNTGFSTAAHLHWGIKPVPADQSNGFKGSIDPTVYLKDANLPGASIAPPEDVSAKYEKLKKEYDLLERDRNTIRTELADAEKEIEDLKEKIKKAKKALD